MDPCSTESRYNIIKRIGEGGAADVFLADDTENGSRVALKIPNEDTKLVYDSLKNEYLFAIRHRHPTLIKPVDIYFESGKPVIVLPFIKGPVLDVYVDPDEKGEGAEDDVVP